jgi:hypothetical protein
MRENIVLILQKQKTYQKIQVNATADRSVEIDKFATKVFLRSSPSENMS